MRSGEGCGLKNFIPQGSQWDDIALNAYDYNGLYYYYFLQFFLTDNLPTQIDHKLK